MRKKKKHRRKERPGGGGGGSGGAGRGGGGGGGGHGPLYGLDKSCQQHLSLSIYTLCYSIQKKEGL